ncbi:TolC family protein, partial [Sinorhizobium meliloti]
MMRATVKRAAALALPLVLGGGCVSASEYAAKNAGFSSVEAKTAEAVGKQTVWIQSQQHARVVSDRVKTLMAKKAIDVETAVQVALLNNKGLQAAYADLGDSAADAWQSTMLVNPTVSVGLTGIGTPGLEAFKSVEGMIANNILALATRDRNIAIADTGFRRAQLNAALRTLQLASDTRRAWINAVAAWETVAQLNQAQAAADAASELAQELGKSGALTKEGQAREHVFSAELAGQTAKARLEARLAKEELTRLMGLWGSGIDYQVPN